MAKRIFDVVAFVVTILAVFSVSTASWFYLYQPKAPKCLTK